MNVHYYIVDAFAGHVFQGAQVAVVPDADGLAEVQMQSIARELNQHETVFVCASSISGNYRLRVFSVVGEIASNGHPLIAAAYLLGHLAANSNDIRAFEYSGQVSQICIEADGDQIQKVRFCNRSQFLYDDFVPSSAELAEILTLEEKDIGLEDYQTLIVGADEAFLLVPLKKEATLKQARFNINKWTMSFVASLASRILVYTANQSTEGVDYHARLLGKGIAEHEDPAVAPAVPAFAASLYRDHGIRRCVVQRGLGQVRQSIIEVDIEDKAGEIQQIILGGRALISSEGYMFL